MKITENFKVAGEWISLLAEEGIFERIDSGSNRIALGTEYLIDESGEAVARLLAEDSNADGFQDYKVIGSVTLDNEDEALVFKDNYDVRYALDIMGILSLFDATNGYLVVEIRDDLVSADEVELVLKTFLP